MCYPYRSPAPPIKALACLATMLACPLAGAKHVDVLLQTVDGRVATGGADFDTTQWVLGQRVYNEAMEARSLFGVDYFATNAPGFNSRVDDRPAGSDALPEEAPIAWDFLPMYAGGVRSDLLYWDGQGTVDFGAPSNARLNLVGDNANETSTIFAAGSSNRTPGAVFAETEEEGYLHEHQDFSLFDADFSGVAPEGVYVAAMEIQIEPLSPSEPIYVVFSTPAVEDAALADAAAWVETRVDDLVLEGDYNNNGVVDAADYTLWREALGASAVGLAADGDGDGEVTTTDYDLWRDNYGASGLSAVAASLAVPEPATAAMVVPVLAASWRPRGPRRRS